MGIKKWSSYLHNYQVDKQRASSPLHTAWLLESFREDVVPTGRKSISSQVRTIHSKLYETFLFKCRVSLFCEEKKKAWQRC